MIPASVFKVNIITAIPHSASLSYDLDDPQRPHQSSSSFHQHALHPPTAQPIKPMCYSSPPIFTTLCRLWSKTLSRGQLDNTKHGPRLTSSPADVVAVRLSLSLSLSLPPSPFVSNWHTVGCSATAWWKRGRCGGRVVWGRGGFGVRPPSSHHL